MHRFGGIPLNFKPKNVKNMSIFVNLVRIHVHGFGRVFIEINVSWAVDSTGVLFEKDAFSSEICGFLDNLVEEHGFGRIFIDFYAHFSEFGRLILLVFCSKNVRFHEKCVDFR